LWRQLGPEDLEQVRAMCGSSIGDYYERFKAE
jgi:hypothetical protein